MTRYEYTGPLTFASLWTGSGKERTKTKVKLVPGEVQLPEDHPYTKGLLARGLITPIKKLPATVDSTQPNPAPADKPDKKGK